MSLGGSGVSIGGVRSLRVVGESGRNPFLVTINNLNEHLDLLQDEMLPKW